jgi:type II secretion system protein C
MVREILAAIFLVLALAAQARADAQLPETTLPLRLMGTVVASNAARSIAVIENSGTRAVVREGDAIGGARVQAIRKDGIVLDQAGRLEKLAFGSGAPASGSDPDGARASAAVSAAHDDAGNERAGARRDWRAAANARRARAALKASASRASAVPASAASDDEDEDAGGRSKPLNSQELLAQLANQARYAPYHDGDGKLHGVALMDVRPDSTLERLGLRSGDVVISIAGVRVDNTTKAFDALRSLNPRAGGEVLVERGGVPTRIAVPPGAL